MRPSPSGLASSRCRQTSTLTPPKNPRPAPSPSRPEAPAAGDTTFMPGVLREPACASGSRRRSCGSAAARTATSPSATSARPSSTPSCAARRCRYSITDLGSHNGTYVNGTRVSRQELSEGDIIAIGDTAFRLAGGELTEYAGGGADGELLAAMIATRLERWLEREGAFEVPGVGQVELAGEIGWEPGSGTLYLRRPEDGRVCASTSRWPSAPPRPRRPGRRCSASGTSRPGSAGSWTRASTASTRCRPSSAPWPPQTRRSSRCWTASGSGQSPRHEVRPGGTSGRSDGWPTARSSWPTASP